MSCSDRKVTLNLVSFQHSYFGLLIKVNVSLSIRRLIQILAGQVNMSPISIVLKYKCRLLKEDETVEEIGMEDNDLIQLLELKEIPDDEHVLIYVFPQYGTSIAKWYFLKYTLQLIIFKNTWSRNLGEATSYFNFYLDGKIINDNDSPKLLDMQLGDIIEIYPKHIGA